MSESTRRLARVPAGSSAVRIDLHAPGISLQCDRMRKSSRSCPYGSASFVETVLMPKKNRHAMTMATQARPIASGVREPVWKSTSELSWTFVSLHAVEPTWPQGQCRVDGVESPRHRADAATESTSRRWRGAPEI